MLIVIVHASISFLIVRTMQRRRDPCEAIDVADDAYGHRRRFHANLIQLQCEVHL